MTGFRGKDRWTSFKFTKNLYDHWMPKHLELLRSVTNALPPASEANIATYQNWMHLNKAVVKSENGSTN
jgi:hypothetical protein